MSSANTIYNEVIYNCTGQVRLTTDTDRRITRREWRWVVIYAVLLLFIVSLPYWLAWAQTPASQVFSGFLFGTDDGNSYLGKMRLGVQGQWDFHIFYTAEEHEGVGLLFLPYILLGQIIGLFVADTDPALTGIMVGTFHLMRWLWGGLLIGVLYRFIAAFVVEVRTRLMALVLATIGGGLGWVLLLMGADNPPPELYIPEGFTLQILLGLPHLALARAALLGGLLLIFASLNRRRWPVYAGLAGLCWLIVGLAVPFYLVIIYCILGGWGLAAWLRQRQLPWNLFIRTVVGAAITVPLFVYNVVIFSANPIFAQWSAQNLLYSPPPLHYGLAYLPIATLAIVEGRVAWRKAHLRWQLLIGWPVLVPVLVYLPINVQRRLAEAVIVPLAILAAMGIAQLAARWSFRRILIVTLLATLPTSLLLLSGGFFTALSGSAQIIYPAAQIAAFDWLNQQAEPDAVVLSAFPTGTRLPAYTNLRVYIGHGPETLYYETKSRVAEQFFADELIAEERATLYHDSRIEYVFFGPAERQFAPAAPKWKTDLERIYVEGDYEIFRLR